MVDADSVTWKTCSKAAAEFDEVKHLLKDDGYSDWVRDLKEALCNYFASNDSKCTRKQGSSVAPIASGVDGAKGLKVRFGFPGCGKSGGLRIGVLAYCERRLVKFAGAWIRKDDPADDEFQQAFEDA